MYLKISNKNQLSLEDADDFGRFHITIEDNQDADWASRSGFAKIAQKTDEGQYWLDADAVADLTPRKDDKDWLSSYWQMLSKAEPYGYYDPEKRRIKAHVS